MSGKVKIIGGICRCMTSIDNGHMDLKAHGKDLPESYFSKLEVSSKLQAGRHQLSLRLS